MLVFVRSLKGPKSALRAHFAVIGSTSNLAAIFAACFAVLVAGLFSSVAQAKDLTTEDFFRSPQYRSLHYSPDGKLLAALAPSDGRVNLFVLDLARGTGAKVTSFSEIDVVRFDWVNNKRLVFSLGNLSEPSGAENQRGGGLIAINADGSEPRRLYGTIADAIAQNAMVYRFGEYLARTPEPSDEIYVAANERNERYGDVYRVNTVTGKKVLVTFQNPGKVQSWVLDRHGVPRIAVSTQDDLQTLVYYRKNEDAPWTVLTQYGPKEAPFAPLAFDYDDKTLYVTSWHESDKGAVYAYDPDARQFRERIYGRDDVDVGVSDLGEGGDASKLIFDPRKKALVGIQYDAAKPGVEWFDPEWRNLQKSIDAALPETFNVVRPAGQTPSLLITAYSDRLSPTYYAFDREKRTLVELLGTRPWLQASDMVEMRPVNYRARDGMNIPSYLFLPKNSDGKNLPLVVNIHGGPWVRADLWHLEMWGPMESQFLASHGYAVLLPNFRGTPGFGRKFVNASIAQWGKSMQEDLEDGVNWLVKDGVVDPRRVCLYGASYGGYATLMGLVKTPDLYRCGIAALAVTDLPLQITSNQVDFSTFDVAVNSWKTMVGDPSNPAQLEYLRSVSPAMHADRIKAPVLMISGGSDRRVPREQGDVMAAALKRAGKPYQWIIKDGEGHGFARLENRVDTYNSMLKFLDENIGKP